MKNASFIMTLSLILLSPAALTAQSSPTTAHKPIDSPHTISISSSDAEKLLIKKFDYVYVHKDMEALVSGTVVMAIAIGKHGEVLYPKVISGPKILQKPALDAVRKYQYKPYLLNGKPVVVNTTVSITFNLS
jgi:protein TonB